METNNKNNQCGCSTGGMCEKHGNMFLVPATLIGSFNPKDPKDPNEDTVDPVIKRLGDSLICIEHGYPKKYCIKCSGQEIIMKDPHICKWEVGKFTDSPSQNKENNQCDGCQRGLPVNEFGDHFGVTTYDLMGCTKERYTRSQNKEECGVIVHTRASAMGVDSDGPLYCATPKPCKWHDTSHPEHISNLNKAMMEWKEEIYLEDGNTGERYALKDAPSLDWREEEGASFYKEVGMNGIYGHNGETFYDISEEVFEVHISRMESRIQEAEKKQGWDMSEVGAIIRPWMDANAGKSVVVPSLEEIIDWRIKNARIAALDEAIEKVKGMKGIIWDNDLEVHKRNVHRLNAIDEILAALSTLKDGK